jgi:hypothetical protein
VIHTIFGNLIEILLVGRFSPKYGFMDKVMEYSPESGTWTVLNITGTRSIGIYGYSAVFHIATLYVAYNRYVKFVDGWR